MRNPEVVTFWRRLASYMYDGYSSKSAFPAGSRLTTGVLAEDLRVLQIESGVGVVVRSNQIIFLVPLFESRRLR
jgi:hypothetical protein